MKYATYLYNIILISQHKGKIVKKKKKKSVGGKKERIKRIF